MLFQMNMIWPQSALYLDAVYFNTHKNEAYSSLVFNCNIWIEKNQWFRWNCMHKKDLLNQKKGEEKETFIKSQ